MLVRRAISVLVVAVCLLHRAGAQDDDGSCPADGSGSSPSCRRGGEGARGGAPASRPPAPVEPKAGPQADLITQEVEELKSIIALSQERIKLLSELQETLKSGHQLPLPEAHARVLQEKVPLLSEVAANVERVPVAASDDFLVSKAVISSDEEVSFVKFMTLRSPRSAAASSSAPATSVLPTALLVAASSDGQVRLFTPAGELALVFSAGHEKPVTQIAVSPSFEEYLLATGDAAGVIRVHKVSVRQRRLTREERQSRKNSTDEKVSQHLGSNVNVTAALHKHMQVEADDGEVPTVTSLALASHSGSKYVLAGDAAGKISVFTRNGTLRGRIDTLATQGSVVDGLFSSPGAVLFRAGSDWGFVDMEKLEARHMECPHFEGRITTAVLDSQMSSRVLAADEAGTVWVFNVRNRKECRVELRFAPGSTQAPVELSSVRGFAIAVERAGSPQQPVSVVALNMSQAGKAKGGGTSAKGSEGVPAPPPGAVVWRRARPPVRAWTVHKRSKEGDLLAFLSEDGKEIEIVELLMQAVFTAPVTDTMGNFKMPVIAVAIVLVLGYQYMKQKGKPAFGGKGGKFDLGGSDLASALRTKKKLTGLRGGKRF